jgi:hypothetical protein
MNSNAMTFEPRFPWVDDERDTRAYITYDLPNKDETYIPTYVIMKQYYDEEKERLYGKNWNKDCIWDYIQDSDEECEYIVEHATPTNPSPQSEDYSDSEYDYSSELSENDNDDVVAQPPSVSNKFWYS